MTFTIREVLERVSGLLDGEDGLRDSLEQLRDAYRLSEEHAWPPGVSVLKAGTEHVEKSLGSRHSSVLLYCEKIHSRPTERFRRFSGELSVGVEVRVTQDRLEGITDRLHYYSDAVRDVLERGRGCIGEGLYLSGETTVHIDPVKRGGRQYLQSSRIVCTVLVNRD
jgi:hypothetical protein